MLDQAWSIWKTGKGAEFCHISHLKCWVILESVHLFSSFFINFAVGIPHQFPGVPASVSVPGDQCPAPGPPPIIARPGATGTHLREGSSHGSSHLHVGIPGQLRLLSVVLDLCHFLAAQVFSSSAFRKWKLRMVKHIIPYSNIHQNPPSWILDLFLVSANCYRFCPHFVLNNLMKKT